MIQGISDKVDQIVKNLVSAAEHSQAPAPGKRSASSSMNIPEQPVRDAASAKVSAKIERKSLEEAVDKINRESRHLKSRPTLSVDQDTNRVLIKFKDPASGEVVRQIPAEAILEMAKHLDEFKGSLVDSQG